ncbi:unnamed protein product [Fusarium graminearum]|nr:unnamed protein product [Fusarium graminearum]
MATVQPAAVGGVQHTDLKALVMTRAWSFNDTDPNIPLQFRNQIPTKYKNKADGCFHLSSGDMGYLAETKNDWGRAIFTREDNTFSVLVPMNRVKVGVYWRPLDAQIRQSHQIDTIPITSASESTRLGAHIRTFWSSLRMRRHELRAWGLGDTDDEKIFGRNFNHNVDSILEGFTQDSRRLFSNGVQTVEQLATLPAVTREWPPATARVIYVRVYIQRAGGRSPGAYVGQSIAHAWRRNIAHEVAIGRSDPHYNVARMSTPENRLMIPLIVWNTHDPVPIEVVDMAEQTLIAMLDTYSEFARSANANVRMSNRFRIMKAANEAARSVSQWPRMDVAGGNCSSPVFGQRSSPPIHCYRLLAEATGLPTMSVYRQAKTMEKDTKKAVLKVQRSDGGGRIETFVFSFNVDDVPAGAHGYLALEIMHGGRRHANPYLGTTTIGPYEDFHVASSLGVAYEWLDTASNQWKKCYTSHMTFRGAFAAGLPNSDVMKALRPWKKCIDVIQLLEGIDYTGDTSIFSKTVQFGRADVRELVVDHLKQTAEWRLRPRRSQPAPKLALFDDNARRIEQLTSNFKTSTHAPPDVMSDMWRGGPGDALSVASLLRRHPDRLHCDFCKHMASSNGAEARTCQRDTRFSDHWVCRPCAIMHRPCTWTARSDSVVYWGQGPPFLNGATLLAQFPTGPHRFLSFHAAVPDRYKIVDTREPIDGLGGLAILRRASETRDEDEEEDMEDLEGSEIEDDD